MYEPESDGWSSAGGVKSPSGSTQPHQLVNKKKHAVFEANKKIIQLQADYQAMNQAILENKRSLQDVDLTSKDITVKHQLKNYLELVNHMN